MCRLNFFNFDTDIKTKNQMKKVSFNFISVQMRINQFIYYPCSFLKRNIGHIQYVSAEELYINS